MTVLCPSCTSPLNRETLEGETVDRCPSCHGIWFDKAELGHVVRRMPVPGSTPADAKRGCAGLDCPRCSSTMRPFNYGHDSGVLVNKCSTCSGLWLEDGQLELIALHRAGTPAVRSLANAMENEMKAAHRWQRVRRVFRSRVLSGALAAGYLVAAILATGNAELVARLFIFLLFPLLCIWFSDTMGGLTGVCFGLGRPVVTQTSPADMVALLGWLVLLLPILVIVRWAVGP